MFIHEIERETEREREREREGRGVIKDDGEVGVTDVSLVCEFLDWPSRGRKCRLKLSAGASTKTLTVWRSRGLWAGLQQKSQAWIFMVSLFSFLFCLLWNVLTHPFPNHAVLFLGGGASWFDSHRTFECRATLSELVFTRFLWKKEKHWFL